MRIEVLGTLREPGSGTVTYTGGGSGFIISEDGLVVTNNHVVTGAGAINVFVPGRDRPVNARLVAASECADLAVIDLAGGGYTALEFFDGRSEVGTEIFVAGYPLGDPEYTLTSGIISKANADGETPWASVEHVIQHDAQTQGGNSGGPVVTRDGKVIGIDYAVILTPGHPQDFAIGLDQALPVIEQLKRGQNVDWAGINGLAMREDAALTGIWVFSVESGSPADIAGIRSGDLVMELEHLPMGADGTVKTYCDVLRSKGSDGVIQAKVLRSDTGEILEGQINGRSLEVVGTTGTDNGETGDEPAMAAAIGVGDSIIDTIETDGDIDFFSFSGIASQTYQAVVELDTLADSLLTLYAPDGICNLTSNDDYNQTLASRLQWTLPSTGTYFLSVENADGVSTGTYSLTLEAATGTPSDDYGNGACAATPIATDQQVTGNVEDYFDYDVFSFQAVDDKTYTITVTLGTLDNSRLILVDTDGETELEENDDYGGLLASRIQWAPSYPGTYYLVVTSEDPEGFGTYTLTATSKPSGATGINAGGASPTS